MPFLQIISTLSSIADQIIGSSEKLKNQKKEQLIRTADALEAISIGTLILLGLKWRMA